MVCIIDDREDIWNCAPNLITVKPYRFFTGTGDINAPPGSEQAFTHPPAIPLHEDATEVEVKDATDGKEKGSDEKMDCEEPKNSSDNSQKSACESEKSESDASSGKEKDDDEIKDNEMESQCDETSEDGKNGETATAKKDEDKEKEDGSESPSNDAEDKNSEKENEDAISKVSEKAKDNDAVDGNHVEDHDDYLLYLEEILRRIHSSFYEVVAWNKQAEENGDDSTARVAPDLRHIVPELRRSVLKGTNLVFTGVIPTNTAHEVSQAWKIAQQFGANVSKEVLTSKNADRSKRTTHVVAARPGTEKACHALRLPSVRLVNPNWLWTCAERWEWVDERLFPVEDHKLHTNDTPNFSRQGTPKAQLERDANSKNSNKGVESDEPGLPISDDNLRIVLNPFLSFSSGEMEAMDKEVEDLMRSSDEEDDKDDGNEEILGTVSSSSNSTENGDSFQRKDRITEEDAPDGRVVNVSKRKEMNFSTIKQNRHEEEGSPSKRRKLDFVEKEEDSEGEFSSDGGSSGDDEGSDMADLLEKELFG
jgi:RNA polymerase II subunit A-like phosphatase